MDKKVVIPLKRKKMPVWLLCILVLCLALSCMGTTWLIAASIADPELYAAVTDPVKAYVSRQIDALELQVKKINTAVDQTIDNTMEFLQEKSVAFQEAVQEVLVETFTRDEEDPDLQALSDALLDSPQEIADPVTTHLGKNAKGQEVIVGGNYELFYFNQTDPQWGDYGSDSISGYGCGPTASAMLVSTLTGHYIDPQEMSDIFVREGYWAKDSGTYFSFANGVGELFELEVTSVQPENITASDLIDHLLTGDMAIALMSTGHFTNGGHFIVLRGVTLSGDILVADPASRDRSLTLWSPQLILDELSPTRYNGSPIWFFSEKSEELRIPSEQE